MNIRPSYDEFFLNILKEAQSRATCNRGKSAALIVKDNRIVSIGYVGAAPGLPHCDDIGHQFRHSFVVTEMLQKTTPIEKMKTSFQDIMAVERFLTNFTPKITLTSDDYNYYFNIQYKENCLNTTHAEVNAIGFAAKQGISTDGTTMYCTMTPCLNCASLIIASGIKKFIAANNYKDGGPGVKLLENSGIPTVIKNNEFLYKG